MNARAAFLMDSDGFQSSGASAAEPSRPSAVQSMPTLTKLLAQNAAVTKARNDVFLALSEALENASRRFTTGAHHEAASELHARFEAYLRDCLRGGPAHPPKPARRAPRPTTSPPPSSTRSPTGASYAAAVTRPAPPPVRVQGEGQNTTPAPRKRQPPREEPQKENLRVFLRLDSQSPAWRYNSFALLRLPATDLPRANLVRMGALSRLGTSSQSKPSSIDKRSSGAFSDATRLKGARPGTPGYALSGTGGGGNTWIIAFVKPVNARFVLFGRSLLSRPLAKKSRLSHAAIPGIPTKRAALSQHSVPTATALTTLLSRLARPAQSPKKASGRSEFIRLNSKDRRKVRATGPKTFNAMHPEASIIREAREPSTMPSSPLHWPTDQPIRGCSGKPNNPPIVRRNS
ncbi:hypothetical protein F5883DRAFT_682520 [Diaporthe sp. PMI_573]|nr:hypothetical protein F5883DRAFT_682520 [Diaporthaceae sp. PMI_573]